MSPASYLMRDMVVKFLFFVVTYKTLKQMSILI